VLLNERIKEISNIIYNYLIQKISAENSKVHSEVLRIIKKLKHVPLNLEELHELKIFST